VYDHPEDRRDEDDNDRDEDVDQHGLLLPSYPGLISRIGLIKGGTARSFPRLAWKAIRVWVAEANLDEFEVVGQSGLRAPRLAACL
jgi:hypothetical protein